MTTLSARPVLRPARKRQRSATTRPPSSSTVFKALADRHRIKILNRFLAAGGDAVCVCDLEDLLGLKQSTVSYHLKQLLTAGIVDAREARLVTPTSPSRPTPSSAFADCSSSRRQRSPRRTVQRDRAIPRRRVTAWTRSVRLVSLDRTPRRFCIRESSGGGRTAPIPATSSAARASPGHRSVMPHHHTLSAFPGPEKTEKAAFAGSFCFIGETGSMARPSRLGAARFSDLLRFAKPCLHVARQDLFKHLIEYVGWNRQGPTSVARPACGRERDSWMRRWT